MPKHSWKLKLWKREITELRYKSDGDFPDKPSLPSLSSFSGMSVPQTPVPHLCLYSTWKVPYRHSRKNRQLLGLGHDSAENQEAKSGKAMGSFHACFFLLVTEVGWQKESTMWFEKYFCLLHKLGSHSNQQALSAVAVYSLNWDSLSLLTSILLLWQIIFNLL